MSILTIAGSPSSRSRSSTLLQFASRRLAAQGFDVEEIGLQDVPADELIGGNYAGAAAGVLRARVSRAKAVLIASPVYKASFAGGLKALLDLLDEKGLAGKLILPIASGGSPAHLLALEYGFKPVLSALGARHILAGIYATDAQVKFAEDGSATIDADVLRRLDESIARIAEYARPARMTQEPAYDLGQLLLNRRLSV